jgi:hypothetical protein
MFVRHMQCIPIKSHAPASAFRVGRVHPEKERVARGKTTSHQLRTFGSYVDHELKHNNWYHSSLVLKIWVKNVIVFIVSLNIISKI